jgi:type II secretory pathway component PulM
MILFNIYLLLFVIVALALAAVYQFLWRPLVRIKAQNDERELEIEQMRQREADLEARLRDSAMHELEKECGPLQSHLGETSKSDTDQ